MSDSRLKLIVILLLIVTGCSQNNYRNNLIPKTKAQIIRNTYGAFTIISSKDGAEFEGELIGIRNDSLIVLGETELLQLSVDSVRSAMMILTENNSRKYLTWTIIATSLPLLGAMLNPDYAGSFALLALPAFALGMIAYAVENGRDPHVVSFPDDLQVIYDISMYSRFPGGIPDELLPESLHRAK